MTTNAPADTAEHWSVAVAESIHAVSAADWDACACPDGRPRNPFLRHAFLSALEDSGSATAETGWQPFHAVLRDPAGSVAGVAPLYVKSHSQGEYVFDHAWADAWHRAGGRYYPKLQCCVPFTPATGPRLLVPEVADAAQRRAALARGMARIAGDAGVSSLHVTFIEAAQCQELEAQGWLRRIDQQFHWQNRGYADFDAFLAALASKKRKAVRRERRDALAAGLVVDAVTGSDLSEAHWDAFYHFYLDTGERKWGRPYLTRAFFSLVGERMPEDVLLLLARHRGADSWIAGALNFIGSESLYGRNWGCIEDHRFLHFELCYYQAIDWAIQHGLARVEAGAQGGHKVARGYEPVATSSAHWIDDPGFRAAVADYLERERPMVGQDMAWVAEHLPFRRTDDG